MKTIFLWLLVSLTGLSLIFPNNTSAKVVTMEKGAVEITRDEVIDDDLFVGAEMVQIDGTVNGDVYAGGETVRVNGTINGDLHVGAGNVYLSGTVEQDVYLGAGNVTITGAAIGDSLLIGAGNVNIDSNTTIGGSLLSGSGNLTVFAPIARNFFAGSGTVDLNSRVGGEARLGAGSINLGPEASVGKDLYYTMGEDDQDIQTSKTASVAGTVQRVNHSFGNKEEMERAKRAAGSAMDGVKIAGSLISFLGALLVGYLGLRFLPNLFAGSAQNVTTNFGKSVLIGFLTTIAALPVLGLLAVTGVGLPLAGILLALLLLAIYIAKFAVGLSFGQWISTKMAWNKMSPMGILALGLVAIYLLKALPILGFLVSLTVLWSGLGALMLYAYSKVTPGK
jgi:hypothetical protein